MRVFVTGAGLCAESAIQALAASGMRAMAIQLPPVMHGIGNGAGFPQQMLRIARKRGALACVGDGASHWPAVHRWTPRVRSGLRWRTGGPARATMRWPKRACLSGSWPS